MIDHLVFVVPELEKGVVLIEDRLGVRAAPGGKHQGMGSHNALLSLRNGAYLEIIAPDPTQGEVSAPRAFGLDEPGPPRLYTWAARAPDIEARVQAARNSGYETSLLGMSRELPDGTVLRWALTYLPPVVGDGVAPFLIRWEPGPHPSETSPPGCELLELRGEHPEPEPVQRLLRVLGVDLPLTAGNEPALIATVRCPKGVVELR